MISARGLIKPRHKSSRGLTKFSTELYTHTMSGKLATRPSQQEDLVKKGVGLMLDSILQDLQVESLCHFY